VPNAAKAASCLHDAFLSISSSTVRMWFPLGSVSVNSPLVPWATLTMTLQSLVSLAIIALVIAVAVNVLS
jgi:hypothetical protein